MIDNHKVVINETTYRKETPYGTQFVKVHHVSVHPLSNSTEIESPEETGSSEIDDANNQISNNDEVKPKSEKLVIKT